MGFKSFIEALKFNDPRNQLQQHPLKQSSTFGVEIEFTVAAAPFEEMKPEWLAMALHRTDFEQEYVEAYSKGDEDYEANDWDFAAYIEKNKKQAWDALWEAIQSANFHPDQEDNEYLQAMVGYWGKKVIQIVKASGFTIYEGETSSGRTWAVGPDGHDSEYNMPVLEIRTGVMETKDMQQFQSVLESLSSLSKQYPQEFRAAGNTGLHVHVHNPSVGWKQGYKDMFSRLAAASSGDEDAVWDASASHDRSFERFAALNKPNNFSTNSGEGAHDLIITRLMDLNRREAPTITISNEQLSKEFLGQGTRGTAHGRNVGTNIVSEHPTVEYRYLSSMMVVENPAKVVQFIQYFIDHTAQMGNKGRIKFEDDDIRIVLTRMPGDMVRIDYQYKEDHRTDYEYEDRNTVHKYPKIPRPSLPRAELTKTGQDRNPDQSFSKWFYSLNPQQQKDYIDKKKTNRQG